MSWAAMHHIVAQVVNAGFSVSNPTDILRAVKTALYWASSHVSALRRLSPNDFELLPAMPGQAGLLWWNMTPFTLWSLDGTFHPLCHAIGYAGPFWEAASRAQDSRFHLSLLLTQEFIPVSANVPAMLHGEPAVRFYASTMVPARFLRFPPTLSGLLTSLTVRWGYFHGNAIQTNAALTTFLPLMLPDCPNLSRFLTPATSVAAQVTA